MAGEYGQAGHCWLIVGWKMAQQQVEPNAAGKRFLHLVGSVACAWCGVPLQRTGGEGRYHAGVPLLYMCSDECWRAYYGRFRSEHPGEQLMFGIIKGDPVGGRRGWNEGI